MQADALKRFQRKLADIEWTRGRMDDLFQAGTLVHRDIEFTYEALFLRAVTSFEAFLEEIFLGILGERATYAKKRVVLRMRATTATAILEILLQGKDYVTWMPFRETLERARLYIKDGRPFSELDDGDRSMLQTITTIRNAIAHRSDFAVAQFEKKVLGSQALLPRERSPSGYLRAPVGSGPGRNRFQAYVGELNRLSSALC